MVLTFRKIYQDTNNHTKSRKCVSKAKFQTVKTEDQIIVSLEST